MYDYIGEIRIFAGTYAPKNWVLCNGQQMNISQYPELFSLLGVTFGGDATTYFKVPDLRGRCPVGHGNTYYPGVAFGTEQVYLASQQLPVHTHTPTTQLTGTVRCNNNLADHTSPVGNTLGKFKDNVDVYNSLTPDADMHDNTATIEGGIDVAPAGNNYSHENRQPSLAVSYIICTKGLYPVRS